MLLDHDEEMEPMLGMHGTLDAELEVQRTTKRAELTAFLCLLRKVISPTTVHVDDKGIIDGLWRGEVKCVGRVDFNLGGGAQSSAKRYIVRRANTSMRIALSRRRNNCRSSRY